MSDTRVLVVDDERSMRELLAIMLKQAGHEVTVAEGGEQAIEVIKSEPFDLVITDLRMRKVDGIAVLRATKEHSPSTVVLVVTAFASTETAVEAMKLGAYDYVTKPFKLDETRLGTDRAGERALFVTEQLGLEDLPRQGAAVNRHERPRAARRVLVDRAGDELLAGPALAQDQHRRIGRGHAIDDSQDLVHPGALGQETTERGGAGGVRAKGHVVAD